MQYVTLREAAALLKVGKVVAFPTETVYGLGASIYHEEAIRSIFALKGRPQDNPLIIHVASYAELPSSIPKELFPFWPGPLTVIIEHEAPRVITGGLATAAFRIPNHPIALELLKQTGPLVAPSANLSGKPSPTTAKHVLHDLNVPVIDGGMCPCGVESTILSLAQAPTILRPGAIRAADLEEALQKKVEISQSKEALAPGMKYRHYAPNAKLLLFDSLESMRSHIKRFPHAKRMIQIGISARELYAFLRECDQQEIDEITLFVDEKMRQDPALMNRLQKAVL